MFWTIIVILFVIFLLWIISELTNSKGKLEEELAFARADYDEMTYRCAYWQKDSFSVRKQLRDAGIKPVKPEPIPEVTE